MILIIILVGIILTFGTIFSLSMCQVASRADKELERLYNEEKKE